MKDLVWGLKDWRNYQIISFIGCVLGILLMLGLWIYINVITGYLKSGDIAELTANNEIQKSLEKITFFSANTFISIAVYIICLGVAFVVETKTMAVGITIIVLGTIPIAITNLWGTIPFAILLIAGLVALTYKFVSCSKCKQNNPPDSIHCSNCGKKI
jgi:hypothetical protein